MSLVAAAVVPSPPLLVPALAGGSASLDEALREQSRKAVRRLLSQPGDVVVVGAAPRTAEHVGSWDWNGFGVRQRGGNGSSLPLALAVGAWLLDEIDPTRSRSYVGIADAAGAEQCAALGAQLVQGRPVRMLVVGDASACRTEKAPGHLDPRAEAFDAEVERALRSGDADRLLALPVALARDLLASGRAAWQVLAGAAVGRQVRAELTYSQAPYGVAYLVATWDLAQES